MCLACPQGGRKRERITEMSSEVVDSNPYSRLMALKRMGIVANYEKIRDYTCIIVGLGGIGRWVGGSRAVSKQRRDRGLLRMEWDGQVDHHGRLFVYGDVMAVWRLRC